MFEKPYKICFLHKEFGTIFLAKILYKKSREDILKVGNKSFKIEWNKPAYNGLKQKTYFIDIDSGNQMCYNEISSNMNPNELDTIVGNKIIRELAQGVLNNTKEKILWFILGAIIGALVAGILVMGIYTEKINELLTNSQVINIDGSKFTF